jgi:3-hydroxybutyryl-CoA dehydratase
VRSDNLFTVTDATPIADLAFDEIAVGQCVRQQIIFQCDDVRGFGETVADWAPSHFDDAHARAMGFKGVIVHGLLLASRFSRLLDMYLPGPNFVSLSMQANFLRAVQVGQTVEYFATVARVSRGLKSVTMDLSAQVASDVVLAGTCQCVIPNRMVFKQCK